MCRVLIGDDVALKFQSEFTINWNDEEWKEGSHF